jgi:rhamnopyranosyl-N-acetylglucosaminyl-diphospho-decaprenol beta-1,3/1,4-galactofuranosyltransferase
VRQSDLGRPASARLRVAAGLLHYRFWPEVRETVDALLSQTTPPEVVVVLDNGSDDGSADRIHEAYPQADVQAITPNVGPIAGFNRLMEALLEHELDAVMVLPHDCRLAPDALERLATRLEEDDSLGAVAPIVGSATDPERVFSGGGEIHPRNWDVGHPPFSAPMSELRKRPPYEAPWLHGAGILMRSEALRATGLYHEDFYYFFDEPDHHLRMRRLGWRLECVPAAAAWDEAGFPSPYVYVRNRLGFLARNAPRRFLLRELLRVLFHVSKGTVRPRPGESRADAWLRLRGLVDFLRGRWGPPPSSIRAMR